MISRAIFDRKIKPNSGQRKILVDPVYNPSLRDEITPHTKLGNGITVATFLGGRGDGTTLNHIPDPLDREQIARNLYMHAYAMTTINNTRRFKGYRLMVDEGLYKPGPTEVVTPDSVNDLAQTGRAIAYKVFDSSGKEDNQALFDIAIYWKDNLLYDKIIADYDIYNPDGSLDFQLILVVPIIPDNYTAIFKKDLETIYNGVSQTTGELIEILS
tara:strand:+ start:306 stop:947 length:642 start_codon:yes stop_codon:yes gene_type:complete